MEFYHVLNRGVDRRNIVLDDSDRFRFVQGLYLYNDKNYVDRNLRRLSEQRTINKIRSPLVYIHAFCLMDNHYHLLLSPLDDDFGNISAYMRKLNTGYAKYFNEKYERTGALWQGKYKSIQINRDAQFLYIPYYIHLNPLDFQFLEWREGKVKRIDQVFQYLQTYRWSSYLHYIGENNYPSLIYDMVLKTILGSKNRQHQEISRIIQDPVTASISNIIEIN